MCYSAIIKNSSKAHQKWDTEQNVDRKSSCEEISDDSAFPMNWSCFCIRGLFVDSMTFGGLWIFWWTRGLLVSSGSSGELGVFRWTRGSSDGLEVFRWPCGLPMDTGVFRWTPHCYRQTDGRHIGHTSAFFPSN